MKKTILFFLTGWMCFASCTHDLANESHPDTEGYASSGGVLILNGGARMLENGSLAYLAPDGNVETDVYKRANGTELGNQAKALCRYGSRLYILCDNYLQIDGVPAGDGVLIVADAATMKKEKAYPREKMKFARPEGSLQTDEYLEMEPNLSNLVVLDERNLFITDAQAAYRFDSTTDELNLIEGSYAFGNQGVTIESIISPNGMMAIGEHVYAGAGGYWSGTKLVEFSKDSNHISRTLELGKGSLISGLCLLADGTLMAATYTRGSKVTHLYTIDLKQWKVEKSTKIQAVISDRFNVASSSISAYGNYLYFPDSPTSIARMSLETEEIEPLLDIRQDAPNANGFDCMTLDTQSGTLYISTHSDNYENIIPQSNVLLYDLNGDTPKLKRCIPDITHYAAQITPVR